MKGFKFDTAPQGSEEWLAVRKGRITGSRFRDALDRTAKGEMSSKAKLYALDTARERFGGSAAPVFVNAAMRTGTEQEPVARAEYEAETGNVVLEAGFAYTDDGRFGCSVDGLVGAEGIIEIKTMVSSDTLFTAMVDGDHSAYMDQIVGSLWILGRKFCDLILWAPDLPIGGMKIVRIRRDEAAIKKLASGLLDFDAKVEAHFNRLSAATTPKAEDPPWSTDAIPGLTVTEIHEAKPAPAAVTEPSF